MCGILGIINKNNKKINNQILFRMMDSITYRGPDDSGFVFFKHDSYQLLNRNNIVNINFELLLAHNRLSIIDVSKDGHQPFTTPDLQNRYWIVFNGEIYNYIELRKELIKKGYKFFTQTDTEVALKAYVEWGHLAQNKFNGMWAIIIYDIVTKDIWISRDRLGKKPLYYYEDQNYLIFSSEIKQMLPLVKLEINELETKAILLTNYKGNLKETSFKNVYRFPYSHSLKLNKNYINYNFIRYWALTYNKSIVYNRIEKKQLDIYTEKFSDIFSDSIKLRLRSDVPLGITLSGGIDSNTILYTINKIINRKEIINCFSSVFDNPDLANIDELSLINESLTKINNSKQYLVKTNYTDLEEFINIYRRKTWVYDSPIPSIGFSGYSVYKKIQETGVKVIIEGQGADELLAGYCKYWANFFQVFKMYKILELGKYFNTQLNTSKLKYLFKGLFSNTIFSKYSFEYIFKLIIKNKAKKINLGFSEELFEYLLYRNGIDKYMQIKEYNLNDALIDSLYDSLSYLLYTGDRDSMMFSVESRLPYLDYRLIEFIINLPENYKIHNGYTKYISRVTFQKNLPNSILWNKNKLGYPDATEYYINNNIELRKLVINILKKYNDNIDYENLILKNFRSVEHLLSDLFFKEQFFGEKLEF
jgi:asparagine synthase (glutamine-hydrolysing)